MDREEYLKGGIMLKEVRVGGFVYKIDFPYSFKERGDIGGQANHTGLTIRVSESDTGNEPYVKEKLSEIILHEILHCIDYVYNNDSLDERQVESLTNGLYQVFKDNDLSELFK